MDNFLMITKQLYDDWIGGDLTSEEFLVIHYLYYKANIITGTASVNYGAIASELHDVFSDYKNPVNTITKLFATLKNKRRILYECHSGRRDKFKVQIHEYPRIIMGARGKKEVNLLDLTQQFTSRIPAELSSSEQRSEDTIKPNTINQNELIDSSSSRGAHIYINKYINKEIDNSSKEDNKISYKGREQMLKALKRDNSDAFDKLYGGKSNK